MGWGDFLGLCSGFTFSLHFAMRKQFPGPPLSRVGEFLASGCFFFLEVSGFPCGGRITGRRTPAAPRARAQRRVGEVVRHEHPSSKPGRSLGPSPALLPYAEQSSTNRNTCLRQVKAPQRLFFSEIQTKQRLLCPRSARAELLHAHALLLWAVPEEIRQSWVRDAPGEVPMGAVRSVLGAGCPR